MRKVKPKKEHEMGLLVRDGKKGKERKIYPTIRIDHEHLPEAKEWKVGDKKHLHLEVHMVGNSQSRFQNEGEYEIHKIGHEDADGNEEDVESGREEHDEGSGAPDADDGEHD